jgi:hypothetical protein
MSAYAEKLKDPRWQKKRLEVLQRDNWKCTNCYDSTTTLHVHHLHYEPDTEPWEYPDFYLQTLCENCHKTYEESKQRKEQAIIHFYRLRFKDDFIRDCLSFILSYQEIARIAYLIWELGVEESEAILEEIFQKSKNDAILKHFKVPAICPACGNAEFIVYEQYTSSKCTLCGYVHTYAENTLHKA